MYLRRILRSERVSQEILSIARGESKLISAYSKPVYAGITFANNLYAELEWKIEDRKCDVACLQHKTRVGVQSEPYTSTEWLLVPPVRCYGNCMISSVVLSRDVLFSAE